MKEKLKTNNVARFGEKSFFTTILKQNAHWNYTLNIDYSRKKIIYETLSFLKYDCIEGSKIDGVRVLKYFSFALNKQPRFKIFYEPQTKHYKKTKSLFKTKTFYLEENDKDNVDSNGETLAFVWLP